jgi:hypothetical protein
MMQSASGQAPVTEEVAGRRFAFRLASPAGAVLLGGLVLALTVAAFPFGILARQSIGSGGATFVMGPVFAALGFVVAWRRPRNPLGWLMLGAVAFLVLSGDAGSYVVADYRLRHGSLPLGWVGVLLQPGWAPAIALFGLTVLLFPGRPSALTTLAVDAVGLSRGGRRVDRGHRHHLGRCHHRA